MFSLSCLGWPGQSQLFCSVPAVLSQLPSPDCPVLLVLFRLSCHFCLVAVPIVLSYLSCSLVMFSLSCPDWPVLVDQSGRSIQTQLFCCPVQTVLCGCPVHMSYTHCPVLADLSWNDRPVLAVLSLLICSGCPVRCVQSLLSCLFCLVLSCSDCTIPALPSICCVPAFLSKLTFPSIVIGIMFVLSCFICHVSITLLWLSCPVCPGLSCQGCLVIFYYFFSFCKPFCEPQKYFTQ